GENSTERRRVGMFSAAPPASLSVDDQLQEAITALLEDGRTLAAYVDQWRARQAAAPDHLDRLLEHLRPSLLRLFASAEWDAAIADHLLAELTALFDRAGAASDLSAGEGAEIDPLSP